MANVISHHFVTCLASLRSFGQRKAREVSIHVLYLEADDVAQQENATGEHKHTNICVCRTCSKDAQDLRG